MAWRWSSTSTARAVDATGRVLVALGISFPGMPGDEKKAVIEDFLRLQGYDHPRAQLESWQWVCERAGASVAVREGKDQGFRPLCVSTLVDD